MVIIITINVHSSTIKSKLWFCYFNTLPQDINGKSCLMANPKTKCFYNFYCLVRTAQRNRRLHCPIFSVGNSLNLLRLLVSHSNVNGARSASGVILQTWGALIWHMRKHCHPRNFEVLYISVMLTLLFWVCNSCPTEILPWIYFGLSNFVDINLWRLSVFSRFWISVVFSFVNRL